MALQTYLENLRRCKYLAAHGTFLAFPTLVDGEVLVQVGFLCEALVAALIGAIERPLACVHTQVVEEVVPLTEVHLAASVLAEEYLYVALGAWVFELVDCEFERVDEVEWAQGPYLSENIPGAASGALGTIP